MNIGAFGEQFPYTNFHDLNLDWIIRTLKEVLQKLEIASVAKVTLADPFDWNITSNYEQYTIVKSGDNAYLSSQPVPPGISIGNTDYWIPLFDLTVIYDNLKNAITFKDDGQTGIASETRYENDLVWLNDKLYKVVTTIEQGQAYTSENTQYISIEEWAHDYFVAILNRLDTTQNDIYDLTRNLEAFKKVSAPNRKVIIIGDSYGMRTTPNYLSILINQMPDTYVGQALSGWGFTNGDFYSLFDEFVSTLSGEFAPDRITDVIFAGGWNDARELWAGRQTPATLLARIRTTCAHAKEVCPNARIHTCYMAWHSSQSVQNQVNLSTLLQAQSCYKNVELGYADTLDDVQFVMRNPFFLDTTLFHPNVSAAPVLASAIHNNLLAGAYNFSYSTTIVPAHLENPGVTDSTFRIFMSIQKGITKIKSVPFTVNGTMTGNVVCKFNPGNMPVVMPDDTTPLYLTGWFKGTADNTTFNYIYAMAILYHTGELKMYINGQALNTVNGTLIIDATVDNTNIK